MSETTTDLSVRIESITSDTNGRRPTLPPQSTPATPAVAIWLDDAQSGEPPLAEPDQSDDPVSDDREPTARQLLRPFWFVGALLMMLDGLTTYVALEFFAEEGAREGNPIGVWAIDRIGVEGMCAAKVLIGVAMMWRLAATADHGHRIEWLNRGLVLRRRPRWKVQRNAAWTLAFSLVLMGVVVGNNLRAIAFLWSR